MMNRFLLKCSSKAKGSKVLLFAVFVDPTKKYVYSRRHNKIEEMI